MPRALAIRAFLPSSLVASALAFALLPGCSSDPAPTVQAGVKFDVIPGANGSAACPVGGGVHFNVGGDNLDPVKNGDTSNGAGVSVACAVQTAGSGFNLSANVTVAGNGTLVISGSLDGSRNAQNGISGSFSASDGLGNWTEKDCVITFPGNQMGVAAGRIWAHIACPKANDPNRNTTCDASADFRLENCN